MDAFFQVVATLMDFGETLSCNNLFGEVCAGGVSKHPFGDMQSCVPSCFLLYQIFVRVAELVMHLTVNQASIADIGGSNPSPYITKVFHCRSVR